MSDRPVIQTDAKLPVIRAVPLALQHLMAMFGATVVGVILNLILPAASKGLAVDSPDFGGELQAEAAAE